MASSAIYETRRKMKEESNKSRSRPSKSSFLFVAVNWRLKTPSPKQSSKSSSQCRMLFFTYLKSKWSTKRIPFTAENSKIECKILYKIEQQIAVYVLMKQMFPSLWHAIDTVKCKTFTARKPTQTTIKCQNIFLLLAEAACENAYIFSVNLSDFLWRNSVGIHKSFEGNLRFFTLSHMGCLQKDKYMNTWNSEYSYSLSNFFFQ